MATCADCIMLPPCCEEPFVKFRDDSLYFIAVVRRDQHIGICMHASSSDRGEHMQSQELTPMPQQLRGLKESEVAARRSQGLTNALPVKTSRTYVQIIGENVFTPINDILFVLGLALGLLGQVSDAVVSVSVVLLNVMVSVIQEVRAKRMLDQIALLNRPTTMVIRDGQQRTIVPEEVVVGDVLQVRPGDQIVVDGPILERERIDVDESSVTAESDLVPKQKGDRLDSRSFGVNG